MQCFRQPRLALNSLHNQAWPWNFWPFYMHVGPEPVNVTGGGAWSSRPTVCHPSTLTMESHLSSHFIFHMAFSRVGIFPVCYRTEEKLFCILQLPPVTNSSSGRGRDSGWAIFTSQVVMGLQVTNAMSSWVQWPCPVLRKYVTALLLLLLLLWLLAALCPSFSLFPSLGGGGVIYVPFRDKTLKTTHSYHLDHLWVSAKKPTCPLQKNTSFTKVEITLIYG